MTEETRLEDLDNRFVEIYEAARRDLLDRQKNQALIVVNEDTMLLYHGGREPQVITGLRPPLYDKLKTLGHVPLAIFCLLIRRKDDSDDIPAPTLAALRDYHELLATAAGDLDTSDETSRGLLHQPVEILERALAFLDRAISDGRVSKADLIAFGRKNVADLNAIFYAATKAQLDACHQRITHLKEKVLSEEDWKALRVLVMGPHMAHKDQNFLQYFSKILRTAMYTDKRLVYYEGEDPDAALDLMGTAILDFQASQAIFGNQDRLHRDVLADGTKLYLESLFPGHDGAPNSPSA